MSPPHRRVRAQHFTLFAQNLEMYTRILKNQALLTVSQVFCVHIGTPCM